MRTAAASLASLAALTAPALADGYANARYGYTLDYPAGLFAPQPEAENGDGRHFKALSGGADLAVWGAYNAAGQSANDIAAETTADCTGGAAPYRLVKPTVIVVSCQTADGIVYRKTYIRGDVLTSFELTYPASERTRWDALVSKLVLIPAK